jgi:hypothetical protein
MLSTFAVVLLFPAVVLRSPRGAEFTPVSPKPARGSRRDAPSLVLSRSRRTSPLAIALFFAGIIGVAITFAVRPDAYTYLAASQMILLPCLGPVFARYLTGDQAKPSRQRVAVGLVLGISCVGFALQQIASLGILTTRLPHLERPDAVFDRLTTLVPEGEPVAVGCRHWHAFQGRNPWREAFFSPLVDSCDVLKCRWLVITPAMGTPSFIDAFILVEEIPTKLRFDQTYAYSVWHRRETITSSIAAKPEH